MARHGEKFPHQLSGGEQQRVALARALAPRPPILLMDEPFSGLDNRLRDGIRDETLEILKEEGTAVLLVTHEPEEAMRMADRIALMRDGRIVQQGAPYNIYNKPVDREAAQFFSDINVIHGVVRERRDRDAVRPFLAPGLADRAGVEIVIRPQHLKIDFDRNGAGPLPTATDGVPARGRVARARFVGDQSIVELAMEHDGSVLKATIPGVFLPKPGTPLWLSLRRDRCFVFPCRGGRASRSRIRLKSARPRRLGFAPRAGGHMYGQDRAAACAAAAGKGDDDMLNNIGPAGLLLSRSWSWSFSAAARSPG